MFRIAVLLTLVLFTGCRDAKNGQPPATADFDVVPEHLGPLYEAPEGNITFHPPAGWHTLSEDQRQRVADALVAEEEAEAPYTLEIVDLFLHTETLSFASLSRVVREGEPVRGVEEYAVSLAASLEAVETEPSSGNKPVERATFVINDVHVIEFRHLLAERTTHTLVFSAERDSAADELGGGVVLRLDYSVPAGAYEDEGAKLESSIGTLRRRTEGARTQETE